GRYTASLWVRTAAENVGVALTLKLREYRKDTGAFVGAASQVVALTTAWQQVSVDYAPQAPGASTLDYSAYTKNRAAAGVACLYADDAAIAFEPAPTASLSVTPANGAAPLGVRADA